MGEVGGAVVFGIAVAVAGIWLQNSRRLGPAPFQRRVRVLLFLGGALAAGSLLILLFFRD